MLGSFENELELTKNCLFLSFHFSMICMQEFYLVIYSGVWFYIFLTWLYVYEMVFILKDFESNFRKVMNKELGKNAMNLVRLV